MHKVCLHPAGRSRHIATRVMMLLAAHKLMMPDGPRHTATEHGGGGDRRRSDRTGTGLSGIATTSTTTTTSTPTAGSPILGRLEAQCLPGAWIAQHRRTAGLMMVHRGEGGGPHTAARGGPVG